MRQNQKHLEIIPLKFHMTLVHYGCLLHGDLDSILICSWTPGQLDISLREVPTAVSVSGTAGGNVIAGGESDDHVCSGIGSDLGCGGAKAIEVSRCNGGTRAANADSFVEAA